jgi:hypothetical protein
MSHRSIASPGIINLGLRIPDRVDTMAGEMAEDITNHGRYLRLRVYRGHPGARIVTGSVLAALAAPWPVRRKAPAGGHLLWEGSRRASK